MIALITQRILLLPIILYQYLISPYLPSVCRYYPSCSNYAKEAIKTHGIKGAWFTFLRVLRCNPFSSGGYDPVKKLRCK